MRGHQLLVCGQKDTVDFDFLRKTKKVFECVFFLNGVKYPVF